MNRELNEEYERFKQEISEENFERGNYLDEDEYIDEYSVNTIDEANMILEDMIRNYLHENFPGKFCLYNSFCICVVSVELAERKEYFRCKEHIVE